MDCLQTIEKLIKELNLQQSGETAFYGEYDGIPLLFNLLGLDPLSLNFKVKVCKSQKPNIKLSEELKTLKKSKNADVDIHGGYAWLSFYNLTTCSSEKLISYLDSFIESLQAINIIDDSPSCNSCSLEKSDTEIICIEGEVARICSSCLHEKMETHNQMEDEANKENGLYVFSILPLLIVCIFSWTLFWLGYDKLFELLNTKRIMIPRILVAIIFAGFGIALSFPLGAALRKSGMMNKFPPLLVTVILLSLTAILGEAAYFTFVIEESSFLQVLSNIFSLLKLYDGQLLIYKIILLGVLGGGILDFSARIQKSIKF